MTKMYVDPDRPGIIRWDDDPLTGILAGMRAAEIVDAVNSAPALAAENAVLLAALEESVKLQSHYAYVLNAWDGGKRMQFADADAWLQRLAALGMAPAPEGK